MNYTIFNFFFSLAYYPFIAQSAVFISNILIYIVIFLAFVFIFVQYKNKFTTLMKDGFIFGGAGALAWVVSKILKALFQVPRPFVTGHFTPLVAESGFSLPSSHATVFAALSVVAFSINRTFGWIVSIATLFIGISRMVVGVHYPLDVLLGFIIGGLIGRFFIYIGKHKRLVAIFSKSL